MVTTLAHQINYSHPDSKSDTFLQIQNKMEMIPATNRGSQLYIWQNMLFQRFHASREVRCYFRCVEKSCTCRAVQVHDVVHLSRPHTDHATHDEQINILRIRQRLREGNQKYPHKSTQQIYHDEVAINPAMADLIPYSKVRGLLMNNRTVPKGDIMHIKGVDDLNTLMQDHPE